MSLSIVAAEEMAQALDILSATPRKAVRHCIVHEPEGMDGFLYDFRAGFTNYEWYYCFDPYEQTYLEPDAVHKIKDFSNSILNWLAEHCAEENAWVDKYSLSLKKIERFAAQLCALCDLAMEHGYGLASVGD